MKICSRFTVFLVAFLLAACAPAPIKEPYRGKKIGIYTDLDKNSKLCINILGFTVFHNKYNSFELGPRMNVRAHAAVKDALTKSGNIAFNVPLRKDLESSDLISARFTGGAKVNKQGAAFIKDMANKYDLDAVIWLFDIYPSSCELTISNQYSSKFSMANIYTDTYPYPALFEAPSAKYLGTIGVALGEKRIERPVPVKEGEVSEHEIDMYIEAMYEHVYRKVHYLLTGDYP